MDNQKTPSLGLALSGSGNRTAFYIGFMEVLNEEKIKVDYIAACSGGALVAAAYACGTLQEFKEMVLKMGRKDFLAIMTKARGKGGLYSLDYMEEIVAKAITKDLNFNEVKPVMAFSAVDIENGELVDLCMGSIARAARISCTTPALFEAVKWGNRVLVDGGVLSVVPVASLKKFDPKVSVSLNLALTRNIFTGAQMTAKKAMNVLKKFLLLDQMADLIKHTFPDEEDDFENSPKFFSTWGKSLDLAIYANKKYLDDDGCDIKIEPDFSKASRADLSADGMKKYYDMGRETGLEYAPKIKELLQLKSI